MKRRRLLTALVFTAATLVVFGSAAAVVLASKRKPRARSAAAARSPARTLTAVCKSPALSGTIPARVYLPSGYASGRRYPVVYFLHGLPAGPTSYQQNAFVASALASAGEKAIVVAPQGSRDADSDREYLDWDAAEDWPQAISEDLTTCIDARFHTIPGRDGRALVGLSAGGYGAMNIGLRNLERFGAVQSWSGYFVATNPAGTQVLKLGSPQADAAAKVPRGAPLKSQLQTQPTQIAFYVGRQDSRFLTMNRQYDASLSKTGIAHIFHTYPGGHSLTLWRSEAPTWLGWALSYLATSRDKRPHPAR
ncbi:MAG TPA: alpha/beta fold hydrolase [Solirubrobacteraceae bacterium]